VGAGWEHEVAPGWTLKGEYRFTKFETGICRRVEQLGRAPRQRSTPWGVGHHDGTIPRPPPDRVSGIDLHAFSIRLTHYSTRLLRAPTLVTRRAAPRRPPWTGLYGGGVGRPHVHAHAHGVHAPSFFNRDESRLPALVRPSRTVNTAFNTRRPSRWRRLRHFPWNINVALDKT